MTDPFQIMSSERGIVRVFTTDLDAEGSSAVTADNVHRLLGSGLDLDAGRIEVFPSTALDSMGLSLYLQEGYGVPEEDMKGVTAALDSLKGLVVLVASGAFKGRAATLDPNPALRFVGAFHEPAAAPPKSMRAPASAHGLFGEKSQPEPTEVNRGVSWPIAALLLLVACALALFLVF